MFIQMHYSLKTIHRMRRKIQNEYNQKKRYITKCDPINACKNTEICQKPKSNPFLLGPKGSMGLMGPPGPMGPQGPQGPIGPSFTSKDCLPMAPMEIWVDHPSNLPINSYLGVFINHGGVLSPPNGMTITEYSGWCIDVHHLISTGPHYTAFAISSFDPQLIQKLINYGISFMMENLPLVNYILNNAKRYQSSPLNFSWGDVQTAIWQFLINPTFTDGSANPFSQSHVNVIKADAEANGSNYLPLAPTDYFAVFLVPVGLWPSIGTMVTNQAIIIQITLEMLPVCCCVSTWGALADSLGACVPNSIVFASGHSTDTLLGTTVVFGVPFVANIVAYGFTGASGFTPPGTPSNMFIRAGHNDNTNGLGMENDGYSGAVHGIDNQHFVQLDLADIIRIRSELCQNPTLTIGDIKPGYGFEILGSNTLADPGIQLFRYINTGGSTISLTITVPSFRTGIQTDTPPDPNMTDLMNYGVVPFRYISVRAFPTGSAINGGDVVIISLGFWTGD